MLQLGCNGFLLTDTTSMTSQFKSGSFSHIHIQGEATLVVFKCHFKHFLPLLSICLAVLTVLVAACITCFHWKNIQRAWLMSCCSRLHGWLTVNYCMDEIKQKCAEGELHKIPNDSWMSSSLWEHYDLVWPLPVVLFCIMTELSHSAGKEALSSP